MRTALLVYARRNPCTPSTGPSVRAVRERLDWPLLRTETHDNDFAVAFLVLADRLGLTD